MGFWSALTRIFTPQIDVRPVPSLVAGEPDASNRERPRQTRAQTRWQASDVESAILAADSGDLTKAAQLCNALRRDGTVQGLLSTRSGGLVRLPRQFRGTPEALAELQRSDDVNLFDRVFPQKELALLDEDGILLGVGVGEILDVPGEQYPRFVRLNPEHLRYRWSEDRWYFSSVVGLIPIYPGDGRWVLHMPGGYMAPWQNALWAALGRAFVAKEHAYLNRSKYAAHLANPARAAISPAGAVEGQRVGFLRKLIAWGSNPAFDLPPGWDIKIIETNGRGFEVFDQVIKACNEEFAIALAGQTVTMNGGTGFANTGVHQAIRSDLIQGDGDALAGTLNAQALPRLVRWLLGASQSALVSWDTASESERNAAASSIVTASTAIVQARQALAGSSVEVDVEEMATRFQIPVRRLDAQPVGSVGASPAPAPALALPAAPDASMALPEAA